MGLTGGIVDIGGLYDCLAGIYEDKADTSILDKYSEIRRAKYNDVVNPISTENLLRLFDQDPDKALENDEFLKMCKRTETDVEFSKTMQGGINILKHDFTQYYRSAPPTNGHTEEQGASGFQVQTLPVVGVSD